MSSNTITVNSKIRPVAIRALSALVKDKEAEDLHDSAHDLLRELRSVPTETTITRVELATVKAEALATALDDLLKTDQLNTHDAKLVDEMLDLF